MTDKVLCPWCGSEMHYSANVNISTHRYEGSMRCEKCGATSPMVVSREEPDLTSFKGLIACEALRRYEPPCRPLTLEEVKERVAELEAAPLWVDDNDEPSNTGWTYGHIVRDWLDGYSEPYGYGWRCWPRKPTEEEREACAKKESV